MFAALTDYEALDTFIPSLTRNIVMERREGWVEKLSEPHIFTGISSISSNKFDPPAGGPGGVGIEALRTAYFHRDFVHLLQ